MIARLKGLAKPAVALAALAFLVLLAAGARRYSTLLEALMRDPLVTEWTGPAPFRVGASPLCGATPCWAQAETPAGFEALDVPRVPLKAKFAGATPDDRAWYRFPIVIPAALRAGREEVAFSPNWVVHRSYQIYVDGAWVGSGNGVDAAGDIVYQKVVIPLPRVAVERGAALVAIAAEIGPADLGIQHLGKILVGPTVALGRLHVEAEYAMGSYYLLFLAAEGAVFVFFALFYLFAVTRPGFGTFVAYAFLSAAVHLSIGNFLEGILPFSARIWLYFLAKAGAASLLGLFLCRMSRARRRFAFASAVPGIGMVAALAGGAAIATMQDLANWFLLAVLAVYVASGFWPAAKGARSARAAAALYGLFLVWNVFIHKTQDFDYRPLADLAFFYVVAWVTVSEFALAQARASVLETSWLRLTALFGRLVGKRLARHLIVHAGLDARAERPATLLALDVRFSNRLLHRHGAEATLAALDTWLALVDATAMRHGGELHKIMGDKALVVWGLTGPAEAAEVQALACAVDLRAAGAALNRGRRDRGLFALEWAGAVATGPVVAGRIGGGERADFSVFGAAVSRVFALLAVAKDAAADLVLDAATEAAAGDQALVEPLTADCSTLIGILSEGRIRTGNAEWDRAFGDRPRGGRIFEAGSIQRTFVPDAKAA